MSLSLLWSHCRYSLPPECYVAHPHEKYLRKNADSKVRRVIKPQALVQRRNRINLLSRQVKIETVQVLCQPLGVVGLGNDDNVPLGGPAQKHLRGGLVVVLGRLGDGGVLEQRADIQGALIFQLEEALRAEGAVGGHGDVVLLAHLDELGLHEVRMVFNLIDGGLDFGVWRGACREKGEALLAGYSLSLPPFLWCRKEKGTYSAERHIGAWR